ncbi:TonB-dependent receptor [Hoylesella shahii]
MKQAYLFLLVFVGCLFCAPLCICAQQTNAANLYTVNITVTEKTTKEPIVMATCALTPLETRTVTNADGKAQLRNVPRGNYVLTISYVGYEEYRTNIVADKNLDLHVQLTPSSLALSEVVVTATKKDTDPSSTYRVGRQAIDHLQATSLADLMQLIPGQLMGNASLTSAQNIQLRTLVNNNTSAFGASVVLDGMPISNNATLTQGGFSATQFVGTDLRQVSADNIDHVEVVSGIPSAEYGDLTSGLIVVHSKVGVTPWQVRAKVNPALQNYSLGKGFSLGRAGVLNFNADYAQTWSDPRMKTRSYNRYSLALGYGYDFSKRWHTDTKLRLMYMKDWSGNDPDAFDDGSQSMATNLSISLNHNARISLDKWLARTLSYTLGVNFVRTNTQNTGYVTATSGLVPIITARQTGYHNVPWLTASYLATGKTEGQPLGLFAKVNDAFYLKVGKTHQSFKLGVDYRYDYNHGAGYYNADDTHPYRPNANGRPRPFNDVPGLHQFSAYVEDNLLWTINRVNRLRIQAGLRFTTVQPFSNLATTALSPRINASFSATHWLDVRAGIGLSSKAPGLDYLYPDKKYDDRVAVNYMPPNDPTSQLLNYHTEVYDVQRSLGLRNATTTKVEMGLDFKLPNNKRLSLLAYTDRTPTGFGNLTQYHTYTSNVYTAAQGLNVSPTTATSIDYDNPARSDLVYMTTGRVGNTNSTINKGVEMNFDFGEIAPLHTSFILNGAYSETKTWSTDLNTASVRSALLPATYAAYGLTPFKVVYPTAIDHSTYRRFSNALQVITHIPALRMVASFTAQAIWYNFNLSFQGQASAIGYITPDLVYHNITSDMMRGYIDLQGNFYNTKPTGVTTVAVADLQINEGNNVPTKTPVTWNIAGRLTKELGKIGGLSLYVNNVLFYEPFLRSNVSATLTQRNTGNFSYGLELYINL